MFQIIYSKKAVKFLKKQDKPTQKRLITAIRKLPLEGDIKKLQDTFALNNVEEVAPEPDEVAAIKAKKAGFSDYEPAFSQEDLMKELGL